MSTDDDSLRSTSYLEEYEMLSASSTDESADSNAAAILPHESLEPAGVPDTAGAAPLESAQSSDVTGIELPASSFAEDSENLEPEFLETISLMQSHIKAKLDDIIPQVEELKNKERELAEENQRLVELLQTKDDVITDMHERNNQEANQMQKHRDEVDELQLQLRQKDAVIAGIQERSETRIAQLEDEKVNLENDLLENKTAIMNMVDSKRNTMRLYYLVLAIVLAILAYYIRKWNNVIVCKRCSWF